VSFAWFTLEADKHMRARINRDESYVGYIIAETAGYHMQVKQDSRQIAKSTPAAEQGRAQIACRLKSNQTGRRGHQTVYQAKNTPPRLLYYSAY
jgi:hypothetical protein